MFSTNLLLGWNDRIDRPDLVPGSGYNKEDYISHTSIGSPDYEQEDNDDLDDDDYENDDYDDYEDNDDEDDQEDSDSFS